MPEAGECASTEGFNDKRRTNESGHTGPFDGRNTDDDGHDENIIFPCREPAKESLCVR